MHSVVGQVEGLFGGLKWLKADVQWLVRRRVNKGVVSANERVR